MLLRVGRRGPVRVVLIVWLAQIIALYDSFPAFYRLLLWNRSTSRQVSRIFKLTSNFRRANHGSPPIVCRNLIRAQLLLKPALSIERAVTHGVRRFNEFVRFMELNQLRTLSFLL